MDKIKRIGRTQLHSFSCKCSQCIIELQGRPIPRWTPPDLERTDTLPRIGVGEPEQVGTLKPFDNYNATAFSNHPESEAWRGYHEVDNG